MFKKRASIRTVVAACLALCMPCHVVFASICICTLDCPCQSSDTSHCQCESHSKTSKCADSICCSCNCTDSQGQPCTCKCHKLPLSGLPFSQQQTRSFSELLHVDVCSVSSTASNHLEFLRQFTFTDTQINSCGVQQPCILFCRFLL